jgi:hypothetical protein
MGRQGAAPAGSRWMARATPGPRRHSSERPVTMPTTTDAKRRVCARAYARAHFGASASDAKRTYGSAWQSRLVSGTVESVHEDDSGKRVSVFVTVMWDLPAGRELRRVNVRSIAAGHAGDADANQDGGRRHRASAAHRRSGSLAPPDKADKLVDAATSMAHGVLWEEEDVLQPVGGEARADCGRCRPLPGT